jgi:hypothetical protein
MPGFTLVVPLVNLAFGDITYESEPQNQDVSDHGYGISVTPNTGFFLPVVCATKQLWLRQE